MGRISIKISNSPNTQIKSKQMIKNNRRIRNTMKMLGKNQKSQRKHNVNKINLLHNRRLSELIMTLKRTTGKIKVSRN